MPPYQNTVFFFFVIERRSGQWCCLLVSLLTFDISVRPRMSLPKIITRNFRYTSILVIATLIHLLTLYKSNCGSEFRVPLAVFMFASLLDDRLSAFATCRMFGAAPTLKGTQTQRQDNADNPRAIVYQTRQRRQKHLRFSPLLFVWVH